ncbi:MAG TPA: CARDB domain-containing protein [Bacteroidales bacterium]|nr:CARDB domain-containing protein [Bacteroidales bacterium]
MNTSKVRFLQKAILLAAVLWCSATGFAQTITLKIDTVKAYRNDSVVVPVSVTNFSGIGAITMYIQFDTTRLAWGRALSWHAGFGGNIPLVHHQNGVVGISWIDVAGITIPDGPLFELKFMHKKLNSVLTMGTASEFANPNGIILQHSATNGLAWEGLTLNPDSLNPGVCIGGNVVLNPKPSGGFGPLTYSWVEPITSYTSNLSTITVSPSVTTSYYVSVTDGVDIVPLAFSVQTFPNIPPAAPTSQLPQDSTTDVEYPCTFSWSPSLHATHYDFYIWPSGQSQPTNPTKPNITQIQFSESFSHQPGTWLKWQVVAKNQCYNTPGQVLNFRLRALPNLHITQATTSQPASGQPITVTWTVKNDGEGPINGQWIDKIWISPDFDLRVGESEDDILLGQYQNVSSLAPGATYVNTQTVQLPQNLMGPYFIWVLTDMDDAYFFNNPVPSIPYNPPPYLNASGMHGGDYKLETNNHDNFFYVQLNFPVPPLADLYTTSIITPGAAFSGQNVQISYTTVNNGSNTTPQSTPWWDKIWLSPDTVFNLATAVELASVNKTIQLAKDSSYTDTVLVKIPDNIFGTYYIFVQNDVTNTIFENIGESNNHRLSNPINVILTPPADLTVLFFNVPDTVSSREQVSLTWTVINQGGASTSQSGHRDRLYLSTNGNLTLSNIDGSAVNLGTKVNNGSIPVGGSYTTSLTVTIPENFAGLPAYFYVFTDQELKVFEHTMESNNLKRSDTSSVVAMPDFTVSNIIIPQADSSGFNVPVAFNINNIGNGTHIPGKTISVKIYLSAYSTWLPDSSYLAKDLSFSASTPLLPGAFVSNNTTLTIPKGMPGPLYVWMWINSNAQLPEVTVANNINRSSASMQIVRPDLVVSALNIPPTIVTGDSVTISYTLQNNGTGHINHRGWKDRIVMSKYNVYYPDSTITVGEVIWNGTTLLSGSSMVLNRKFLIPHPYSGSWYFYVITDLTDSIYEKTGELNNVSLPPATSTLTLGPWADLEVMTISIQDTATQGDNVPVTFSIKNTGTCTTGNIPWKDRVYISSSPVWNSSNLTVLNTQAYTLPLLTDEDYQIQVSFNVPLSLAEGFYYIYVFTDFENKIYEYTDEGNNILRSYPIYIKPYPPIDLVTNAVSAPAAANSGTTVTVGWSVQNIGQGTTLAPFWFDGLYLSQDQVFSPATDTYLGEKKRTAVLSTGQSYSTTSTVTIPNGFSGNWYLLVVADRMDVHYDINRTNNTGPAQAIAITLTPSPDLVITGFATPTTGIAGQPVNVQWEVKNSGFGPTLSGGWTDFIYLSTDQVIDPQDVILGSVPRTGNLALNQTYTVNQAFTIPMIDAGNYIVLIRTDNNNVEYEHNAEHNNIVSSMMFVNLMPPCELEVVSSSFPDTSMAGETITVSWVVGNAGTNDANGVMRDNIHISPDTLFDVTDPLLGYVFGNIHIPALGQITRSKSVTIPGMVPGDYHIIIRTDVQNNINEINELNNTYKSVSKLFVDLPVLEIGTTKQDTLYNMLDKHFRIPVPDTLIGESMMATLEGDSAYGVNELYLSKNRISTRLAYDYSHSVPYQPDQEILVPSLDSGSYYMLAYGMVQGIPVNYQEITLKAEILEFDIRSINDDRGGNTGPVTILINGSKFDTGMVVFLDSLGITIPAIQTSVIDISKCLTTFNLNGASLGKYDVVAVNQQGDTARLPLAFRVIQGADGMLGINVLTPANSRPGRISAFTIEFGNTGNVDLVAPVIKLESLAGAPIAYDPAGLAANNTVMLIPLSLPGEPPNILRPGVSGSIMIYTKSTAGLGFLITKQ